MERSGGRIGAETGEPAIPHFAPQRRSRLSPAFLAFYLINAVAFIGYTLLATHVSWLP